ncbi:MAG: PAS domain S-box protein [Candidatus Contendobacter sp.]|nr:MAG: PAS domain S-box protein [Candidatus Contendobacter sp.]
MSLLTKILLIVINTVVASIVILYLVSRFTLLDGYQKIEHNDARTNILRVVNTFHDQSRNIIPTARAYAVWDDMYQFVEEPKQAFLDSLGLTPSLYATQKVNLIAILDVDYRPAFLGMYDIQTPKPIEIPPDLLAYLKTDSPLLKLSRDHAEKTGVILLEGRPMFVVSLGSLRTDFSGDPRGAVILGRFLDEKVVANLAEAMQFPVFAYRLDDSKMPRDVHQAHLELRSSSAAPSISIKNLNEEFIAGYTYIRTLENQPAFIIKAVLPRHIYAQGLTSLRYFSAMAAIAGLGFIILTTFLLRWLVLAPLTTLSRQISWIRVSGDQSQRLCVRGRDELASLGIIINQMLEALETASAEKYRTLVENINDVVFALDIKGCFSYISPVIEHLIAYTDAEMVGQPFAKFIHPDDLSGLISNLERTLAGTSQPFEFRMVAKDKAILHARIHGRPLSERGETVGIAGVMMDITERKRAEEALKHSEATLRSLFSAVPVGLVTLQDRVLRSVNERFCEIVGHSRAELVGHGSRQFYETDEEYQRVGHAVYDPLWDAGFSHVETRFRRADGTWRDVSLHTAPLQPDDRTAGAATAVQDITEQKRTEAALRASEERLRDIANNVPGTVYQFYARPTGELGFYYISERADELFGIDHRLEDAFARFAAQVAPEDRESFLASIRQAVATTSPWDFEGRLIKSTGAVIWFKGVSSPTQRAQELVFTGIILDITDRKRVETELRQHRERLEELVTERTAELQRANAELRQQHRIAQMVTEALQRANAELRQAMEQLVQAEKLAALGHLVAGVAHELNTPLGNARTVAGALGEDLRAFATAVGSGALRRSQVDAFLSRGREAVDLLERNTARAADLIAHFKQVAVDQSSVRRRRFDLRQTVEELLVTLRPQFKRTAHRIALDIPPGLELDSYPGPLEQVIANLTGNSLVHGFARVEAGCIRIEAAPLNAGHIRLRYGDDGSGIPDAIRHRIFDPFFTTHLGSGGSGLGLYIVYNLVTGVLGGTIQVDSSPGHGATFSLVLPTVAPVPATPDSRRA